MNERTSNFIDASRWIAAFLVLIGHIRHLILADYKDVTIANKNIIAKGIYFVTGLGHEAVVIFLLLMGFLLAVLLTINGKIDLF